VSEKFLTGRVGERRAIFVERGKSGAQRACPRRLHLVANRIVVSQVEPAQQRTKCQSLNHERSEEVADVSLAVLAQSSPSVDAWIVQREGGIGPLHMMKGGSRVGTPAPMKTVGADASGVVREMSSDEMPGLPICFFSLDEKWLFVNQIVRADPETGRQWRTAALYWRNDSAEGNAPIWKAPMSGSFEDMAWDAFARRNQVPPESVAPPDANGFRDRTIEFVNWSMKASRVLPACCALKR